MAENHEKEWQTGSKGFLFLLPSKRSEGVHEEDVPQRFACVAAFVGLQKLCMSMAPVLVARRVRVVGGTEELSVSPRYHQL